MSPHDPRRIYAGSQFVHESADGGRTWTVISPDLTTNDKAKQQVPPGLWPETQDVPSTLIAIEESAIEPDVIWTGSKEVAELKLEQMLSFHESRPNGQKLGPLGVRIEPAPG